MSPLYAAFLRLAGRRCVVVGGGKVAARKVCTLLDSEAYVVVIAPRVDPSLAALAADDRLRLEQRPFRDGDLADAFLVVAATDDRAINARIVAEARTAGILANSVDEREPGDVIVPATIRRGDIVVAISTSGQSPAFARHLREELEGWLTPQRLELFELLAELRRDLRDQGQNPPPDVWRRSVDADVLGMIDAGDRQAARDRLRQALGER